MNRRSILLQLLFVFVTIPSGNAQVDGFNKGKGNMDVVGSLSYDQGLSYYLAEGSAAVSRFVARGLTKDLDVQLSVPFIASNGASGLQDGQLFLKWLPLKAALGSGKISFGAALGASAPLMDYETEGLGAIGQQATSLIPMGVLQYSAGSGYFTSLVGGQFVTQGPTPDALTGTLRFGHATSAHYWEAYLKAQEAYGGKDYRGQGDLAPTTFKELGVSYVKVGGKYYRPLGDRFGYVGELGYVLAGRNVDKAVTAAFSFILHFRK